MSHLNFGIFPLSFVLFKGLVTLCERFARIVEWDFFYDFESTVSVVPFFQFTGETEEEVVKDWHVG